MGLELRGVPRLNRWLYAFLLLGLSLHAPSARGARAILPSALERKRMPPAKLPISARAQSGRMIVGTYAMSC